MAEIVGSQPDLKTGRPWRNHVGDIEFPAIPSLGSEIDELVGFPYFPGLGNEPAEENPVVQGKVLINIERKQHVRPGSRQGYCGRFDGNFQVATGSTLGRRRVRKLMVNPEVASEEEVETAACELEAYLRAKQKLLLIFVAG